MTSRLVFSPDTLVRFRRGRILVHTTASSLPAYESDQPQLIGWLAQFMRPTAVSTVLAQLPEGSRGDAKGILDYLVSNGALVEAAPAVQEPATAVFSDERSRQHLKLLARGVYDLACDVHAMGAAAEATMAQRTGIGIERRLMALVAAIDGLRSEMFALRAPFIQRQLTALGLTPESRDLKLHIGCGRHVLSGWVNIDVDPAPLSMNVLWGLPFAEGAARYVFVSHLLEHLFHPRDVAPFLGDIFRVLAPGATVRLVVPDVERCAQAYVESDALFHAGRREHWPWWPKDSTRLEDFLAYAGVGPEPAYLFEAHKYGYDFETLKRALERAGFVDIVRSEFMQSAHDALRVDDASAVAAARYGERYYSLFVEASRPGQ